MIRKLLAVILAVVVYNLFFFAHYFPAPGTFAFVVLISALHVFLWTAFFPKSFGEKENIAGGATLLSLLLAWFAVYRVSDADLLLFFFSSLGLGLVSLYFLALSHREYGAISEFFIMPLIAAFEWLREFLRLACVLVPRGLGKLGFIFKPGGKRSSWGWQTAVGIIRGIIIAFPVVFVVTFLLRLADPVFTQYTDKILAFLPKIQSIFLRRIVESLIVAVASAPVALLAIRTRFRSPLVARQFSRLRVEALTVVSLIALVLAGFLLVQFRYVFARVPETALVQFGVATYSEYVRRGFVELTVVSVIVYLTTSLSYLVERALEKREALVLKRVNLVLLGEILIFIVSIFRRVSLYQLYHGLTRIRVYGSVFLMVLMALTLILVLRHLYNRRWYLYEAGLVVAGVLFIALINPDRLIATTYKPTVNGEVDYTYISRLQANAVDGWIEAYRIESAVVEKYKDSNPQALNADDLRRLIYAQQTLQALRGHYRSLIARYGSEEEFYEIDYRDEQGKQVSSFKGPIEKLRRNLAEEKAYRMLISAIRPVDLASAHDTVEVILDAVPQEHYPANLDRSSQTPLLR